MHELCDEPPCQCLKIQDVTVNLLTDKKKKKSLAEHMVRSFGCCDTADLPIQRTW